MCHPQQQQYSAYNSIQTQAEGRQAAMISHHVIPTSNRVSVIVIKNRRIESELVGGASIGSQPIVVEL